MTAPDPIDDIRAQFTYVPEPTATELDAQRARLDAALGMPVPAPRRRWFATRRWLPSGIAVACVGAAILVAVALQPGGTKDRDRSTTDRFRLVGAVPGGAFAGLDLESASAEEVLRAAGRAAADGVPEAGRDDWTYVRIENKAGDLPGSVMERWTSPDGERSYAVSTVDVTNPAQGRVGAIHSVHYEHLAGEVIGDVQWIEQADGSFERRANWGEDIGDNSPDIARLATLNRLLRTTRSAADVGRALDESIAGARLRFQNGMACGIKPDNTSCGTSGFLPQAQGLDEVESKRLYLTGQLLTVTVSNVFGPEATKAIYDYLAALPEAAVAAADDGSGQVILSLRVKGPSYTTTRLPTRGPSVGYQSMPVPGSKFNTKAVAAIDPATGRLVQLNPKPEISDMTVRYTRFGIARGPGDGSELCEAFSKPCSEARDLERRLRDDPDAQFEGVVDWMFISQFCHGSINRDGTPRQGNRIPPGNSNDPKVVAAREACERREAAAVASDPR